MTATFPGLLIFDCDGVLVDSEMIASESLANHLQEHGFQITAQQCRDRFTGYSFDKMMAEQADDGADLPADFLTTLRQRDVVAFARHLQPIPNIVAFLRRSTTPRCVASSGKIEKIRANLGTTGFIDFFDPNLFSGDMVSHPKPAPDLFLFSAAEMGMSPADCLVIEDSVLGVQAALAAGMAVLGFTGGSHCGPDHAARLRQAGAPTVFDDMIGLQAIVAGGLA